MTAPIARAAMGWTWMLCLLSPSVHAQPAVTSVQGTASHGESITISGTDFGDKDPAAPLRYTDFEDGEVGGTLPGQEEGGWHSQPGDRAVHYSQGQQRVAGEMCVVQDYSEAYNKTIGLWRMDVSTLYFSGWCYRDDYADTALSTDNRKLSGNFGKYDPVGAYGQPQNRVGTDGADNYGEHFYATDANGVLEGMNQYYTPQADLWDRWFRLERWMFMGEPNGDDGHTWIAHDLHRDGELTGTLYRVGEPYDYFLIGHYYRRTDGALLRMYWGELYVDTTQARVEIGDADSWDDCTHREIQIPSAWRRDEIIVRVNSGSFATEDAAFLFVVDADGQPSHPGFPLEIGASAGPSEDAGLSDDAGHANDGGSDLTDEPVAATDGGCGCRSAPPRRRPLAPVAALLILGLVSARRRTLRLALSCRDSNRAQR